MTSSSLPLAPSSSSTTSLESDSHRQLRYVRSGMEVTSGATLDVVARGLEGEDREAAVKELRGTMAEYVRMERDLVDSLGAVEDVRARMAAEAVAEEGEGVRQWDVLAEVASAKEERTSGAIELEVAKHPELIKFERKVDEILGRASFEPSSSNVVMKEDEDEDCVATQVSIIFHSSLLNFRSSYYLSEEFFSYYYYQFLFSGY